ncbi:hypothetical protein BDBG_16731 [Blastomyces gilchristii SLH14081]|uniref:Uncharacterized protein n=1 Tax=Blastomyces gilchristii (strain SLH14081) TaxID=559298 RepID=A0A179UHY3_BLAGS|nr:uncharacterized protein BDBG_16731 [Blastomyces gilchristii SLH14081]OAT06868.1 hypothetical protein BDBG_16731 [Blastomyces gilchristii SLH14081]
MLDMSGMILALPMTYFRVDISLNPAPFLIIVRSERTGIKRREYKNTVPEQTTQCLKVRSGYLVSKMKARLGFAPGFTKMFPRYDGPRFGLRETAATASTLGPDKCLKIYKHKKDTPYGVRNFGLRTPDLKCPPLQKDAGSVDTQCIYFAYCPA